MNREIEFRGFDGIKWYYGNLKYNRKVDVAVIHIYEKDGSHYRQYTVDPDTVGQFTGLRDANGRKIYEGDVVRIYDGDYENYSDQQVKFAHGVFGVDNWTKKTLTALNFFIMGCDSEYSVEVIGNIYDNSELLDKKE